MITAAKNTENFYISFVSHEGKLVELTILGGDICISVVRNWLRGKPVRNFIQFWKSIFEKDDADKMGKDIWFLMILLFNE